MTQAYLYKWTHKSTNQWYVGSRYAKGCHPSDGYICSSKYVKPMILGNPDDWIREILFVGDVVETRHKESSYLKLHNAASNPMSLNRHNASKEFHNINYEFTPEVRQKISKKLKGRKPVNLGKSHTDEAKAKMQGRSAWNKGINTGLQTFTGRTHTESTKQKMSEALKLVWAQRKVAGV